MARAVRASRLAAAGTSAFAAMLFCSSAGADPLPGTSAADDIVEARADWTPPILNAVALFATLRITETFLWPDPFARTQYFGDRYLETFTKPPLFDADRPAFRWDGDSIALNMVGHGLMGSELYLRARTCAFGWAGSLAFAAGASAVWEYAFEGNGVRPSAQDLVYTPLMGLALGELRYFVWSRARSSDAGPSVRWLRYVFDPIGEFERVLGSPC